MRVNSIRQVKDLVGERLYWDDVGTRWIFIRSDIVVGTYRNHVEFENQAFYEISDLKNLRTTYEK
jgi:hypothetical protein